MSRRRPVLSENRKRAARPAGFFFILAVCYLKGYNFKKARAGKPSGSSLFYKNGVRPAAAERGPRPYSAFRQRHATAEMTTTAPASAKTPGVSPSKRNTQTGLSIGSAREMIEQRNGGQRRMAYP